MDHRKNVYYEDEIVFELHSDVWVVLFQAQKKMESIFWYKRNVKRIGMQENMMLKTGLAQ